MGEEFDFEVLQNLITYDNKKIENNFYREDFLSNLERDFEKMNNKDKDFLKLEKILEKFDLSNENKEILKLEINKYVYVYNVCYSLYLAAKTKKIMNIMSKPIMVDADFYDLIGGDILNLDVEKDINNLILENEVENSFINVLENYIGGRDNVLGIIKKNNEKLIKDLINRVFKNKKEVVNALNDNIQKEINKFLTTTKITELCCYFDTNFIRDLFIVNEDGYDNNNSLFTSNKLKAESMLLFKDIYTILKDVINKDKFIVSFQYKDEDSFFVDNESINKDREKFFKGIFEFISANEDYISILTMVGNYFVNSNKTYMNQKIKVYKPQKMNDVNASGELIETINYRDITNERFRKIFSNMIDSVVENLNYDHKILS